MTASSGPECAGTTFFFGYSPMQSTMWLVNRTAVSSNFVFPVAL